MKVAIVVSATCFSLWLGHWFGCRVAHVSTLPNQRWTPARGLWVRKKPEVLHLGAQRVPSNSLASVGESQSMATSLEVMTYP